MSGALGEKGDLDEKYEKPPRQDRPPEPGSSLDCLARLPSSPGPGGFEKHSEAPRGERERERGEREAHGWISCPSSPPRPGGLEQHELAEIAISGVGETSNFRSLGLGLGLRFGQSSNGVRSGCARKMLAQKGLTSTKTSGALGVRSGCARGALGVRWGSGCARGALGVRSGCAGARGALGVRSEDVSPKGPNQHQNEWCARGALGVRSGCAWVRVGCTPKVGPEKCGEKQSNT